MISRACLAEGELLGPFRCSTGSIVRPWPWVQGPRALAECGGGASGGSERVEVRRLEAAEPLVRWKWTAAVSLLAGKEDPGRGVTSPATEVHEPDSGTLAPASAPSAASAWALPRFSLLCRLSFSSRKVTTTRSFSWRLSALMLLRVLSPRGPESEPPMSEPSGVPLLAAREGVGDSP
eukprot:CAMPEP_0175581604 /NCGR_PEP_ID=MMETSP0096-20121207/47708_1 /TAXON_ID=311494 /ORGANISM="Alexandrium monilatum, Strain CCMP3105" /LENGTH=177 /DNA_ID=CAMNT_0016885253 /DNA_START=213 /DNA_END=742 /DNA_ORIENTATION=+